MNEKFTASRKVLGKMGDNYGFSSLFEEKLILFLVDIIKFKLY
jgi:hypothetical protein